MASQVTSETGEYGTYLDEYLSHYSPAPFPALSGVRPEKCSNAQQSVSILKPFSGDLQQAVSYDPEASFTTVLKLAWSAVLLSYSGPDVLDIAFGLIQPGSLSKTTASKDNLAAAIPVRCRTRLNSGVKVTVQEALSQLVAHERKVARSLKEPTLSPMPGAHQKVFNTFLVTTPHSCDCDGVLYSAVEFPAAAVLIHVAQESDGLRYTATFTEAHLNEQAAQLMLQQLDDISHWVLCNPTEKFENALSGVSISLKALSNPRTSHQASGVSLLQEQFEGYAASTPDRIALIFTEESTDGQLQSHEISYGSLNTKARRLAQYLSDRFVAIDIPFVPILMDKSPDLYAAILGILKFGGAWCPIDTLSPGKRQHDLIARTESPILLVDSLSSLGSDIVVPEGVEVINVREIVHKVSSHQMTQACAHITNSKESSKSSERIAYLIWTSGTTGPPKGVLVSHAAAVASMTSLQATIPGASVEKQLRCMQFSQPTFDVFVQDIFYTWGLGGAVISAPRELMTGSFARLAAFNNATHVHLTPAFAAAVSRSSCSTLEVVTMIGERLPQHVADNWGENMLAFKQKRPWCQQ